MRYRLALALALLLVQSSSAPTRVAIVRATAFAFDDESISIQVRVEPHADNRQLKIAALDHGEAVRSSTEQLDGAEAPRTRWIRWGHLPAGEMVLTATVFESGERPVARASWPITVLSRR